MLLAALVATGLSTSRGADASSIGRGASSAEVTPADFAAAMVALPDGGLRFGERLTGRVRDVTPDGRVVPELIATVAVSTDGQRGLLGLAVDAFGRTFAAWTRRDRRLVVGQIAPGPERLVWVGPKSSRLANGGHLVTAPDGDLIIGIGNLQASARVADPHTANGKILRLDPDGMTDQQPRTISAGWNNPFAFIITPSSALWVADNIGKRGAERLARGDVAGRPTSVTRLRGTNAPSGLAAIDDNHLAMCGYVSRRLDIYDVTRPGHARRSTHPLATDCAIGVIRLGDGALAYDNETSIRTVRAAPSLYDRGNHCSDTAGLASATGKLHAGSSGRSRRDPGGFAMVQSMKCPGCLQPVDVTRPADVGVSIDRDRPEGGRSVVVIRIGKVQVHRCVQCTDGAWR